MGKKFMGYDNASELLTAIGNKIKAKYTKPNTGIPKSDLATGVQTSLDQISTNQSNILYSSKTGAQNIIICSDLQRLKEMNPDSQYVWWEGNVYKSSRWSFTINGDGSITINGTFPAQTFFYLELSNSDTTRFKNNGIMRLTGCPSGGSENSYFICIRRTTPDYYWFDSGSGIDVNTSESNFITSPIQIFIGIRDNVTLSNQTFYPSLVLKTIYEQDSSFHIGALPNYDLTRLEAEDRAGLVECVDGGAKNILAPTDLVPFGDGLTNNPNLTCTNNGDGTYTLNGSTVGNGRIIIHHGITSAVYGGKMLSGCPNINTGSEKCRLSIYTDIGASGVCHDAGQGNEIPTSFNTSHLAIYVFSGNTFNNVKFYPMICTKAAFGVSQKFVPYCRTTKVIADLYKEITGSTTLTNTGLEYNVESGAKYRITAYAEYGSSNPLEIVIVQSNGVVLGQSEVTSPSGVTIGYVVATGYIYARTARIITLKARFASATSNYVGMIIEKL